MASRFLIYALTCPRCGAVRYVGKSTAGMSRPRSHFAPSHLRPHNHRTAWLRSLKDAGLHYGILVLEEFSDADGINEAERRWIAHGRAAGWPLTNGTDGGDGMSGRVPSQQMREKSAAAQRGQKRPHNIDKNKSPEMRAKVSAALKGRVYSEETLQRMREAAKRRNPASAETRAKWAAKAALRRHTADELERMGKAQREVWARAKARAPLRMRINLFHG